MKIQIWYSRPGNWWRATCFACPLSYAADTWAPLMRWADRHAREYHPKARPDLG